MDPPPPITYLGAPSPPPSNPRLSRSPRPYRRTSLSTPNQFTSSSNPPYNPLPSPIPSPLPSSESGTEADDELTRRLPAPPSKRKLTLSEEDTYYGEVEEEGYDLDGRDGRGGSGRRRRKVEGGTGGPEEGVRKGRRKRIVFVRRGIEVTLMGILVGVVLVGGEGVVREVRGWRVEFSSWLLVLTSILALYPLQILLRSLPFELPRSLDPAPLLYPILFPVLVSLSLTVPKTPGQNQYILPNLLLSLSSLPPSLLSFPDLHWALSLLPLVLHQCLSPTFTPLDVDIYPLLPPLHHTLVAVLNHLLEPSLTQTEIRLIATALINLLLHASTPQAVVLKAILWGGGLTTLVTCSDVIKANIDLARVPPNRLFRRAGNTVLTIARLRRMAAALRPKGQTEDSECEVETALLARPRVKRSRGSSISYYATLTPAQYRWRKWGYPLWVYGSMLATVIFGLRPYIASHALGGVDPFVWGPSYLLCGQPAYQLLLDTLAPGEGYCVTAGSTDAANLRLAIVGLWALIIAVGITVVFLLTPYVQVDTRRKVFHGMVVLMFLIPGVLDPPFTHLCLSLALGAFIILDIVRAGQLPPASRGIARFLAPFVDGRDLKGPVVVSHVFLLIGCGAGWWLTVAREGGEGWEWTGRTGTAFVSGVVAVGLGDAAASLVGRRWGRTKWGWRGGKSVQGSVAFMVVVAFGIAVGRWWIGMRGDGAEMGTLGTEDDNLEGKGGVRWGWDVWVKILAVGAWGSMVEAVVTGVNDNVVVPVGAWVLVVGLGV